MSHKCTSPYDYFPSLRANNNTPEAVNNSFMKALKQTDSKDNLCLSPLDLHFVDTAIVSVVNADRQQPDHAALDLL